MRLDYAPSFKRQLRKLSYMQQKKVDEAIKLFSENPFYPSLCTHKLKGKKKLYYAFKAGYDLRVLFEEKNGFTIIIMVDVGTHDHVYY